MSEEPTFHHCHSCPAVWSKGQWTPECPECGGGPLEIDCRLCMGRCGAKWQRAVLDSHDHAQAHWIGTCLLSDEDQKEIRENGLAAYEEERRKKTWRGRASTGTAAWAFMALLAVLVMGAVKNSDHVLSWLGRSTDDVAQEVLYPRSDEVQEAGRERVPGKNVAGETEMAPRVASEVGQQSAQRPKEAKPDSSTARTSTVDTTRREFRDVDSLMPGAQGVE